jgi:putative membrane protein
MKINLNSTIVAMLLLASAACDDDDNNASNASQNDKNFLRDAAYANLAEIQAGDVAEDSASNQEVKTFASHMVSEHNTAWNDLKGVANDEDIDLPGEPDQTHKAKLEYLKTLNGYRFDTAYVNSQVKDHKAAIALFTQAQSNADDGDIRAYATKYLPHLQEHLSNALELQAALADGP